MKDVSRRTLESLIKFIYSGEVNVDLDGLGEFLHTAKALEIKGLIDENITQSFDNQGRAGSKWPAPVPIGFQYQTSRTVQVPNPVNSNSELSHSHHRQPSEEYQRRDNFDANGTTETGYELANNYVDDYTHSYRMDNGGSAMNQFFDVQDNQFESNYYEDGTDVKATSTITPKVKRAKRTYGMSI